MFTIAGLLVSVFFGWPEALYLIAGKDAQGEVLHGSNSERWTSDGGRGYRTYEVRAIEYTFVEPDGTLRKGEDTLSPDSQVKRGEKVWIRYTPGQEGRSRLAGNINWRGVAGFFASVLSAIAFVGHMIWDASRTNRNSATEQIQTDSNSSPDRHDV